ncbi:MAG: hypothetical protein RRA94_09040 [Bacteroidota bacterium]|nr:hypothetical protein [Bacteroidota bacterium]
MNRLRVTLSSCMLSLFMLPAVVSAQAPDNSIEASWERAATTPPVERRVQPTPPAPKVDDKGMEYGSSAWDASRKETSRPWPTLSTSSTAKEYFEANTAVIDSLSRLYCISSNYITTLRIRNQQSMQGDDPQLRAFSYEGARRPAPTAEARPSVQALHKELMQLLERCLVGR